MDLHATAGLRELSLFSGAGGGLLGSRLLGWKTVAYVEWNDYCQDVLRARIRDGLLEDAPIFGDVGSFDGTAWRDKVDVVSGGFPCFAAGSLVLTMDGHKPIEDVRVGELVLTHRGRWRRVNAVMARTEVPVRRVTAQGLPEIICSDNHPFYVRRDVPRLGRKFLIEPDWVPAKDITSDHFASQVLPPEMDDDRTEAFWKLVGLYLAEGCLYARRHRIILSIARHETDAVCSMVREAGFRPYPTNVPTGAHVVIENTEMHDFLAHFGKYAHGKLVPGWVLALPEPKARAILDGYLFGDGHRGAAWEANTTSLALGLSMAVLAHRAHKVVASLRRVPVSPTKHIQGRLVNQKDYYALRIPARNRSAVVDGVFGWKKIKRNESLGLVCDVFNLAVEEDHSYTVNGIVVSNCQPFSQAGKREGEADERNRWPDTIRIIREVGPRYAFLENVSGLLTNEQGYFGVVLRDLAESGFDAAWRTVSAASVGAPHRRERLWILARRRGL